MPEQIKIASVVLHPLNEGQELPAIAIDPETGEPFLVLSSRKSENGIPAYNAVGPKEHYYPIIAQAVCIAQKLDAQRKANGFPEDPRGMLTAVAMFAFLIRDGVDYALGKVGLSVNDIDLLAELEKCKKSKAAKPQDN